MRRKLLTLCSALSLLLCAAACVLWAGTYRRVGTLDYTDEERDGTWRHRLRIGAHSERGGCAFLWENVRKSEAAARWRERHGFVTSWSGRRRGLAYGFSSPARQYPLHPAVAPSPLNAVGFQARFRDSDSPSQRLRYGVLVLPHWSIALAAAVSPALWSYRRMRGGRRSRRGVCPACGYDLRATPGRCPECGTVAPVLANTAA